MSTGHYLTFELDNELYGFQIENVQSVLDFENITRVPGTPGFMRGVINLRGRIVPIIDLKLKFGLSKTEKTRESSIIIVEIEIEGEKTLLGVLADAVREVVFLESEQIEPAPRIGTHLKTEFIQGVAHYQDQLIILLEMVKVFSSEELILIDEKKKGEVDEKISEAIEG